MTSFHHVAVAWLLSFQSAPIIIEDPAYPNPVIKTIEARCGPNVYKFILLMSAETFSQQLLSFSINAVEVTPLVRSKFSRLTGRTHISDINFGRCVRRNRVNDGIYVDIQTVAQTEPSLFVLTVIGSEVFSEAEARKLLDRK